MTKLESNREGTKWIEVTKALLLFRPNKKCRVQFWAPRAGIKRAFGLRLLSNCRLNIRRGHKKWIWDIRLPFFYWERSNAGCKLGLPNLYLWWHVARV